MEVELVLIVIYDIIISNMCFFTCTVFFSLLHEVIRLRFSINTTRILVKQLG